MINPEQDRIPSEVQEKMEIKIRTPLLGEFFPENAMQMEKSYNSGELLSGIELVRYEDAIREAADRENNLEGGTVCNLMEYFYGSESVKEKVKQAVVSVENVGGILYGCTTLQVYGQLESEELSELCEFVIGQYNDGWGEGFGQRDIQIDGGKLNVHFRQGETPRFWIQEVKENSRAGERREQGIERQGKRMCR